MNWVNPYKTKLNDFPGRLFNFDDFDCDLSQVRDLISSSNSIYLELGSGSGLHLIELAKQNPNSLVFGFELRFKRSVRTLEKAQKQGVANCYVLRISYDRLEEIIPEKSIKGVFINFPDPWAKKKQKKHRILGQKLLNLLPKLLTPTAFVSVKTDHAEYFSTFYDLVSQDSRYQITAETRDLYSSELLEKTIATEFEKLFENKGCPINHLVFMQKQLLKEITGEGK